MKKGFIAKGTTCDSCSEIIKKQAMKVEGVNSVEFDYSTEIGYVDFDETKTDFDTILYKIEEKPYTCYILGEGKKNNNKLMGWIFGIIGVALIVYFGLPIIEGFEFPQISQGMGYGLLLIVGLLTGFHCISMCGGFVVSYTAKAAQEGKKSHKSHLMYGLGKTVSYTIIGAIFGLIGSIFAFTPMMRGVAGLIAGLFLVIFGLKMLNIIPALRKFQLRIPKGIAKYVGGKQNSSPLVIGLLNGLMIACGPLQAIYIMAAGTGSMIEGAKVLFIFGIGTLPALLGFGYFASFVSSKMTHKILKASGAVVIVLGILMINNGLALTGTGFDVSSMVTTVRGAEAITGNSVDGVVIKDGYQEIRMTVDRYGWSPDKFILKKGVPVKWVIEGEEINGCNNAIQVPAYGLNFDIKKGEQVIEFTPDKEGTISWSCWMGMIPGQFIVQEDVANAQEVLEKAPELKGGSCGGGSGCGCGA